MDRRCFAGAILAGVSGFLLPRKIKADVINLNDMPRPPIGTRITSRPLSYMVFRSKEGEDSNRFRLRAIARVRELNQKRIISVNESSSGDKIIFWCEQ